MNVIAFIPAMLVLAYSESMHVLAWYDGKRRSALHFAPSILAVIAMVVTQSHVALGLAIIGIDAGSLALFVALHRLTR